MNCIGSIHLRVHLYGCWCEKLVATRISGVCMHLGYALNVIGSVPNMSRFEKNFAKECTPLIATFVVCLSFFLYDLLAVEDQRDL